jgi:hypothetical protein
MFEGLVLTTNQTIFKIPNYESGIPKVNSDDVAYDKQNGMEYLLVSLQTDLF